MLERLERLPTDPILGLMAAFRARCGSPQGRPGRRCLPGRSRQHARRTAVRQAEQAVLARQTTKTYVAAGGQCRLQPGDGAPGPGRGPPGADRAVGCAPSRPRRVRRAPARCGAHPRRRPAVGRPREHPHLGESRAAAVRERPRAGPLSVLRCRLRQRQFRARCSVRSTSCRRAPSCCCMPRATTRRAPICRKRSGASCWRVVKQRGLLPFIDMAYQGLGGGVAEDAFGPAAVLRRACRKC